MKLPKLLSKGETNAKLAKSKIESYIMYFAPYNLSGVNVCPAASPNCSAGCLYYAGHGAFNSVQLARLNRTQRWINDKETFYRDLYAELTAINKRAVEQGKKVAVRLNGTSDIAHFTYFEHFGMKPLWDFSNIIFYDYTKRIDLIKRFQHTKYHLTFSRSETNDKLCHDALAYGANVAVVFDKGLPSKFWGLPVIDGDKTDERFTDPQGDCIIGLRAKGKAKKDRSGFVVRIENLINNEQ